MSTVSIPKIAITSVYFGEEFPPYFNWFLYSAGLNQEIDFFIFTNINYENKDSKADNIKFVKFSLEDFNKLATKKIGLNIKIVDAYKLCDFKPTYGFILEDYFKGYDWWGHCDIDIILGKITDFYTSETFNNYDIISARKQYLSGFLTLYRNTPTINSLFKKSRDWRMILRDSKNHYCFDECAHEFSLLHGTAIENTNPRTESMTHLIYRLGMQKQVCFNN